MKNFNHLLSYLAAKVANQGPVMSRWSIANTDVGVIWVVTQVVWRSVVVEIDGKIAEDASWLRKPNDANHIIWQSWKQQSSKGQT